MGFIVNPIAGMGGKVGLKGTDNVVGEAVAKGAAPTAPDRAEEFLEKLKRDMNGELFEVLTCPGIMGAEECRAAGVLAHVLSMEIGDPTTAEDTKKAVMLLGEAKADLIVFVGGDGTAKDVLDAMEKTLETLVLGVPAGVKMYSGVFAVNTSDAAEVVAAFAKGDAQITQLEVLDADETAIRMDTFSVKFYGHMKGPFLPAHIQGSKQVTPETLDEKENQTAIARFIVEQLPRDATLILGPGTTVKQVADLLGVKKTLLGVDVYRSGKVALDADEERILEEVKDWRSTWIILSPIGRQGILLGRGNQQISPPIIKMVGKERIVVAATKSKLQNIEGNVLRVDTGDAEADALLRGYIRVVTDYREWRLVTVQ